MIPDVKIKTREDLFSKREQRMLSKQLLKLSTRLEHPTSKKIKELIAKGVNVNVTDSNGHTPLQNMFWNEKYEIAKLLINNGAKINVTDSSGKTILHYALEQKKEQFVRFLIFSLDPKRRLTSLFSGLIRCSSNIIFALGFICLISSSANCRIDISFCVAILISSPIVELVLAIFIAFPARLAALAIEFFDLNERLLTEFFKLPKIRLIDFFEYDFDSFVELIDQ